jgi:hypothetical protein
MTRANTGGKGIRTPGLLIANETLYQLSYTPANGMQTSTAKKFFQRATTPSPLAERLVGNAKIGRKKRSCPASGATRTICDVCRANIG